MADSCNVRFGSLADLLTNSSLMSAFPESGRSGTTKTTEIKVRFRPEAASRLWRMFQYDQRISILQVIDYLFLKKLHEILPVNISAKIPRIDQSLVRIEGAAHSFDW